MSDVHIPLVLHLLYPVPSVVLRILQNNVVVIEFSERVIDFLESHIEITGGTLSDFIGNGRQFCVTVETDSTAELYVPAGVVVSENNQPNTESNRLVYHA